MKLGPLTGLRLFLVLLFATSIRFLAEEICIARKIILRARGISCVFNVISTLYGIVKEAGEKRQQSSLPMKDHPLMRVNNTPLFFKSHYFIYKIWTHIHVERYLRGKRLLSHAPWSVLR